MNDTSTLGSAVGRAELKSSQRRKLARLSEAAVWQPIAGSWRPLYGGFYDLGVSIETHDFQTETKLDWSRSFHPESLELCLNLSGDGAISHGDKTAEFKPLTAGFYKPGKHSLRAWREAGQRHQFITIEFSSGFLREHLAASDGALHPLVEKAAQGNRAAAGLSKIHRLTADQQQLVARLMSPPVFQGARDLWYRGKILELMAEFFFERQGSDELFCDRQKRTIRERVDRVIGILRNDLIHPPGLEEIGRAVGCSPFYLSRIFSKEMGMTIPQFLRQTRMERAAELLRSGKYNVTEAALEVGYNSLSHFSTAFHATFGCCPGLYPMVPNHAGLAGK